MKCCCHPLKKKKRKEKPKICRRALSIVVSLSRQADRVTSGSCSRCSSKSSFKDHGYQLSPGRMKQLLCLLNPKKFKTHWGKILPCLTNIIRHKIFSLSRIPRHDVQINISDRLSPESDFASEHLRSCFFSSSEFFFSSFFFSPFHTVNRAVSQVLAYAVISSMGQWADNRMHKRLCQKSSGLICTSYQITP